MNFFNDNNIALMSLQIRFPVKASMVLTRVDHLFILNYIRSLQNSILRPILMVRKRRMLERQYTAYVPDAITN